MIIGQLVDIGNHEYQGSIGQVVKLTPKGVWLEFPFEFNFCYFFPYTENWIMIPFNKL